MTKFNIGDKSFYLILCILRAFDTNDQTRFHDITAFVIKKKITLKR